MNNLDHQAKLMEPSTGIERFSVVCSDSGLPFQASRRDCGTHCYQDGSERGKCTKTEYRRFHA